MIYTVSRVIGLIHPTLWIKYAFIAVCSIICGSSLLRRVSTNHHWTRMRIWRRVAVLKYNFLKPFLSFVIVRQFILCANLNRMNIFGFVCIIRGWQLGCLCPFGDEQGCRRATRSRQRKIHFSKENLSTELFEFCLRLFQPMSSFNNRNSGAMQKIRNLVSAFLWTLWQVLLDTRCLARDHRTCWALYFLRLFYERSRWCEPSPLKEGADYTGYLNLLKSRLWQMTLVNYQKTTAMLASLISYHRRINEYRSRTTRGRCYSHACHNAHQWISSIETMMRKIHSIVSVSSEWVNAVNMERADSNGFDMDRISFRRTAIRVISFDIHFRFAKHGLSTTRCARRRQLARQRLSAMN